MKLLYLFCLLLLVSLISASPIPDVNEKKLVDVQSIHNNIQNTKNNIARPILEPIHASVNAIQNALNSIPQIGFPGLIDINTKPNGNTPEGIVYQTHITSYTDYSELNPGHILGNRPDHWNQNEEPEDTEERDVPIKIKPVKKTTLVKEKNPVEKPDSKVPEKIATPEETLDSKVPEKIITPVETVVLVGELAEESGNERSRRNVKLLGKEGVPIDEKPVRESPISETEETQGEGNFLSGKGSPIYSVDHFVGSINDIGQITGGENTNKKQEGKDKDKKPNKEKDPEDNEHDKDKNDKEKDPKGNENDKDKKDKHDKNKEDKDKKPEDKEKEPEHEHKHDNDNDEHKKQTIDQHLIIQQQHFGEMNQIGEVMQQFGDSQSVGVGNIRGKPGNMEGHVGEDGENRPCLNDKNNEGGCGDKGEKEGGDKDDQSGKGPCLNDENNEGGCGDKDEKEGGDKGEKDGKGPCLNDENNEGGCGDKEEKGGDKGEKDGKGPCLNDENDEGGCGDKDEKEGSDKGEKGPCLNDEDNEGECGNKDEGTPTRL